MPQLITSLSDAISSLLYRAAGIPARNEWPERLAMAGPNTFSSKFLKSDVNWEVVRQVPSQKLNTFFPLLFSTSRPNCNGSTNSLRGKRPSGLLRPPQASFWPRYGSSSSPRISSLSLRHTFLCYRWQYICIYLFIFWKRLYLLCRSGSWCSRVGSHPPLLVLRLVVGRRGWSLFVSILLVFNRPVDDKNFICYGVLF